MPSSYLPRIVRVIAALYVLTAATLLGVGVSTVPGVNRPLALGLALCHAGLAALLYKLSTLWPGGNDAE